MCSKALLVFNLLTACVLIMQNCKTCNNVTAACSCKVKLVTAAQRNTSLKTMYAQLAAQQKKYAHLYTAQTYSAAAAVQAALQAKYNTQKAYSNARANSVAVKCTAYYATQTAVQQLVNNVLAQYSAQLKQIKISNSSVIVHLQNASA